MSKVIKIKKGLDIPITGHSKLELKDMPETLKFAIKPSDFKGLDLKLNVKQGSKIKAGDTVMFDKNNNNIIIVSPVSGEVIDVNRGFRRKILEVVIQTTTPNEAINYEAPAIENSSREEITKTLLQSGLWPYIQMRPYGIVANPTDIPRDIFISCFDSSPLAPDYQFALKDELSNFESGLKILAKLTTGKVHLGLKNNNSTLFDKIDYVEKNYFEGPHPAGNVGIQIHKVKPINKNEIVWTVQPQDVATIGKLFSKNTIDFTKVIALTGSEVSNPIYYKVKSGCQLAELLKNEIKGTGERIISGNVLTGTSESISGFLGFYHNQITVIPDGNYYEMFGWIMPRFNKFSTSHSYFSWLMPNKKYKFDANMHGEERAFVMTGEYEKVLPMDILPTYLLKAILTNDIDRMEQLGIYEVVEEDLALCEFVCTSKIEVQDILRNGLNLMIKETM